MVDRYDADNAPDPAEWLALEELTRIQPVEEHHRLALPRFVEGRLD